MSKYMWHYFGHFLAHDREYIALYLNMITWLVMIGRNTVEHCRTLRYLVLCRISKLAHPSRQCISLSSALMTIASVITIRVLLLDQAVSAHSHYLSRPLPWWVLHGRGYVYIRVRLLPVVAPGDYLASILTLCLPHWLLVRVQCPMIWGCISTSLPPLLICVYAPEGHVSWSHVCPLSW